MVELESSKSHGFPRHEYDARLARLRKDMYDRGIDVVLLFSPEELNYLTGFDPLGLYFYQFVLVTADPVDPIVFTHKCESELARAQSWTSNIVIWEHGQDPVDRTIALMHDVGVESSSTVGLEMGNWYLRPSTVDSLRTAFPATTFSDVTTVTLEQRMIKSPLEILHMRTAARYADLAMATACEAIRPGVREIDVLGAVQDVLARSGSEYPALPFIIGSGPRSGLFHAIPTDRIIQENDPIMVELTGVSARYNSNIVRTLVAGQASSELSVLHGIVEEAFLAAFAAIRPGTSVSEIDRIARAVRRDYDTYIPSRCGFGMELAYPPVWLGLPDILVGDSHVFIPGMVLSLEPSIAMYHGITVICGSNILVTGEGAEILHHTPVELFELAR